MRVAILTGEFPSFSEAWLLDQLNAATEAGIEIVIVGERPAGPIPHEAEAHRLGLLDKVHYMPPAPRGRIGRVLRAPAEGLATALTRGPRRLAALDWRRWGRSALSGQILRAASVFERLGDVDLVHTHHGGNAVIAAALRSMGLLRAPILATFHGSDALAASIVSRHRGYRSIWPVVEAITTNTSFLRDAVVRLGAASDRITVLPMGIRTGDFAFRPEPPADGAIRCATVGRLIRLKGIDTLIEAAALIDPDRDVRIELEIVGDGEERRNLAELVAHRGLEGRVTFHGFKSRADVIRILTASHLFANPSRRMSSGATEAQGVAPLEAQAIGLPTIVSDSGGLPETIDSDKSGVIVPADDPEAMAAALRRLGEDAELRASMGRAGRRWVEERFDARVLGERLVSIYERIAAL